MTRKKVSRLRLDLLNSVDILGPAFKLMRLALPYEIKEYTLFQTFTLFYNNFYLIC